MKVLPPQILFHLAHCFFSVLTNVFIGQISPSNMFSLVSLNLDLFNHSSMLDCHKYNLQRSVLSHCTFIYSSQVCNMFSSIKNVDSL